MSRVFFKIALLSAACCLSLNGMKKHEQLEKKVLGAKDFTKKMRLLDELIESPYEAMWQEPYIPRIITDLDENLFKRIFCTLIEAAKVEKENAKSLITQFQCFLDVRSDLSTEDTAPFEKQYCFIEAKLKELQIIVSSLNAKEEKELTRKRYEEIRKKEAAIF